VKNICFIKKTFFGSLLVVPITFTIIYLIYLSVITDVALWPNYALRPLILYLMLYISILIGIGMVVYIATFVIICWMRLIMRIGGWVKSRLDK
jgi:hypothetical protein